MFSLSEEIKESAFESLNNQWATIVLDGWKNPVTGNHHLSFLMFQVGKENNRPIFLKSIVMSTVSANDIQGQIQVIIDDLKKNKITPIACVSDNAPSMIRAVEDIFSKNPSVLPVRCSAHVLNLVIKDLLKKVDFLKNAFAVLLDYISKKLVRRYCETRWNSIFDRFVDLQKHFTANGGPQSEISCVTAAIGALEPFIKVLNLCQKDGSEWNKIYHEFVNAIAEVQSKGLENVALAAQSRKSWILNEIIALNLFYTGELELSDETFRRISDWLNAINVTGFEEYAADREFHGYDTPVPRKLRNVHQVQTQQNFNERCGG